MMIKVLTNLYKNSKPLFLFSSKRPKGNNNDINRLLKL